MKDNPTRTIVFHGKEYTTKILTFNEYCRARIVGLAPKTEYWHGQLVVDYEQLYGERFKAKYNNKENE